MESAKSERITMSVREQLLADRRSLLDLGTRNRLINLPLRSKGVRTIEIVDERAVEVHRLLLDDKGFTFLPGRQLTAEERTDLVEGDFETGGIPQPAEDEEVDSRGMAKRHSDRRLQTRLTSEGLQKRLFDIWYDARTLEEEQGVNILYLALGLLRWFEADNSEIARHAPLVLLPVRLDRTSAADRFTLRWRNEPASPNLSLQAKMNAEFGLKIGDFGNEDDFDLAAYLGAVAETVAAKPRWEVLPDAMVLGFFSFAKFLMYRDLDPGNWPPSAPLDQHPVIARLLRDGFDTPEPIVSDYDRIDTAIPPASMNHVVDADSSQTVAIEEVVRGRHLVIKGPPGTGKSQTITNVIAAAAAKGQRVLFVAEKMAALDVVHRRLRDAGLGALTLELHSNKANKRTILEELKRTKELTVRPEIGNTDILKKLTTAAAALNVHADMMHTQLDPSGITPYRLMGDLARIKDGNGLSDYALLGPQGWTAAEVEERRDVLDEIAQRVATIGDPSKHPWRGVRREALDPSEIEQLNATLQPTSKLLHMLRQAARLTGDFIGQGSFHRVYDLDTMLRILAAVALMPACDRASLSHAIWDQTGQRPGAAIKAGEEYSAAKESMQRTFADAAWSSQLEECRTVLATRGRSLFRIFSGAYRAQTALLRSYLNEPMPKSIDDRIELVDRILSAQQARRAFDVAEKEGADAFGTMWAGESSDWPALTRVAEWRSEYASVLPSEVISRLARASDLSPLSKLHSIVNEALPRFRTTLDWLVEFLDLDLGRAFGASDLPSSELVDVDERLKGWSDQPEAVTRWIAFYDRCQVAAKLGLEELVLGLLDGRLSGDALPPTFDRSYFESLRADFFARLPNLKRFDRELHDKLVQAFGALDGGRIASVRRQIAASHAANLPRAGGGIGPLGVLNGEIAKKRNHLPIRQLLKRAGPVVQQIKPVFMMSPLSVAQFLEPGALSFDVLVMDEASQIEPVDALGAIARCGQVVVVGDERQLPPTRFFAKLTSDAEERDEDDTSTFQARDAESVLDLCLAKGMPHRMLNWHYRSKHHSLIAVSNREFYENRLFIVPSPYDAVAGMGLKFNYLPTAHYDRGNTRTNPKEARAIAEAVIAHARSKPEHSLGVAAFSVAQRQAILKELELLRRAHPETEDYFNKSSSEPFFVKNLENIQGDERDVIFISVGYGRTSQGYLAMNFGPLSGEGGERRLNVLISRAKLRCEVFSSIIGDDIELERTRSRGVAALKMFLTFAQSGKLGISEETGRGADSLFEEQVADRLRSMGYDMRTQIGSAGFFVDIAIADPDRPGRYILGIECDGAQYHSARSVRDRDRLRQSVLEDHGWIIHRIWSTDWYLRPKEGLEKVVAAIEAAKAAWRERDDEAARPRQAVPLHFTVREEPGVDVVVAHVEAEEKPLAVPYVQAALTVRTDTEPHEAPAKEMAKLVAEVVATEGPIHRDEIVTRIRAAWGLARSGSRIRDAVKKGIAAAKRMGSIVGGPFYTLPDQEVRIRDRSAADSPTLRKPEFLPPSEVDVAILAVIDANFGADREDLVVATARLFGFGATSAQLRALIEGCIEAAVQSGALREEGDSLARTSTQEAPAPAEAAETHHVA